ncbi:hypothetical protein AB4Y45_34695 [Paraburkholderia sp. EG287A]|uniref:hypothetical protein n=1 Tax=Paraburkholderia sp. EG287A TaxID=3237012 RepID=UPI0034D169FE
MDKHYLEGIVMSRITFSNLVSRLKQLSKNAQARAKIDQTFQLNNRVRRTTGARTQQTFVVYEVDCGTARVLSEDESLEFYVNWFAADGHFLASVADQWELVSAAPKAAAPAPRAIVLPCEGRFNPEYLAALGRA